MLAVLIGIVLAVSLFLIILVLMLGGVSALFPSKSPPRFRMRPQTDLRTDADDLLPEYDFSQGQRGRYTDGVSRRPGREGELDDAKPSAECRDGAPTPGDAVLVALAPDVAGVFKTADAVNAVLRALIATMPPLPAADRPCDLPDTGATGADQRMTITPDTQRR
jgi:hypothetical protein